MSKNKKSSARRNIIVVNMINRSANAGPHKDRKKEDNKKRCRNKKIESE